MTEGLHKVVVAVGTYEGVIAGWEWNEKKRKLAIAFASPVHTGSIRSLALAAAPTTPDMPGALLSSGYDEMLRTHDFSKRVTGSGEVRTPADFGTPVCSSFAPPAGPEVSTHCLVGFEGGKLVIYKKRDWSVHHVLAGHEGGVAALAVHPTGKLALTGGETDGKLKLWDLTKGRLAYATKVQSGGPRVGPITSLVWSPNGEAYGFAYGSHVTVREVGAGADLLDVEMPSKVNQICVMGGDRGLFVAAACNDGSLPVLAVQTVADEEEERRAIMAIEPVDGPVAGEERFKCIQVVRDYLVATANSAGVVSLMDLRGAVNMIMSDNTGDEAEDAENGPTDENSSDEEDDEEDLAVEIIDGVQLGTGARVTCMQVWCYQGDGDSGRISEGSECIDEIETNEQNHETQEAEEAKRQENVDRTKRKRDNDVTLDSEELTRARKLVSQAKKIQKRKEKRNAAKGAKN